jgi:hypothetical protein
LVEDIAFNQSVRVLADVKGVAGIVEPVIIVGMPVAVELEFWGATGGVVDIVASESYVVSFPVAEAVELSNGG